MGHNFDEPILGGFIDYVFDGIAITFMVTDTIVTLLVAEPELNFRV